MKHIVNLLFEARILKDITRSGYAFLGSGRESIAEHSFMTAFICFAMAKSDHDIDCEKLVTMALVHDLAEARTGDFNYVQKNYSKIDEEKAIFDLIKSLSFGNDIKKLVDEFNLGKTIESKLAHDADQISFILELKKMNDTGVKGPEKWLPHVLNRLKTDTGKKIAKSIMETDWDEWWMNDYSE
jgi:putative hydrolases of HD superfamily